MEKKYLRTPEGRIHYLEEGKGEPLLLLHQTGLSSDQFIEVLPLLSKDHHVLAPDLLGYGNSDVPRLWITIEEQARSMIHFLDALHIERTHIFGRFLGSSVAVELAAAYPERVNKLILSALIFAEPEVFAQRRQFWSGRRMRPQIDGSHLVELWQEHMARGNRSLEDCQRAVANYMRSNYGFNAEDAHDAIFTYDVINKCKKITQPTLLLYSSIDSWLKWEPEVRKAIPHAVTRVMENVKYYPAWEVPEEFSQTILNFIK